MFLFNFCVFYMGMWSNRKRLCSQDKNSVFLKSSTVLCLSNTKSPPSHPVTQSHYIIPKPFSHSTASSYAPSPFLCLFFMFINACFSQCLMFIFSVSLRALLSLHSSVLSTQRGSVCNMKAIHNLQDVLSAISIPTPQRCQHRTVLLSISLIFAALSNAAEWVFCFKGHVFCVHTCAHQNHNLCHRKLGCGSKKLIGKLTLFITVLLDTGANKCSNELIQLCNFATVYQYKYFQTFKHLLQMYYVFVSFSNKMKCSSWQEKIIIYGSLLLWCVTEP